MSALPLVLSASTAVHFAETVWRNSTSRIPPGTRLALPATAGIVLALGVVWSNLWHPARNVITWCHELGHALVSIVTGGDVRGIKLHRDTSGETTYSGKPGIRAAIVAFSGHPAPALLGLILCLSARLGFSEGAVAGIGVMALLTLPLVRNFWAIIVLLLMTAAAITLLAIVPPGAADWTVTILSCFLLAGSLKGMIEEQQQLHQNAGGSRSLATDTLGVSMRLHIPAAIVQALWILTWMLLAALSALLLFN